MRVVRSKWDSPNSYESYEDADDPERREVCPDCKKQYLKDNFYGGGGVI